jgi:hypothetical protein
MHVLYTLSDVLLSSLVLANLPKEISRDGILGHQLNKRLQFFAICYSRSLLLADFKENLILFSGFKTLYKKSPKQVSSFGRKEKTRQKLESEKTILCISYMIQLQPIAYHWRNTAWQ